MTRPNPGVEFMPHRVQLQLADGQTIDHGCVTFMNEYPDKVRPIYYRRDDRYDRATAGRMAFSRDFLLELEWLDVHELWIETARENGYLVARTDLLRAFGAPQENRLWGTVTYVEGPRFERVVHGEEVDWQYMIYPHPEEIEEVWVVDVGPAL